MKHANNIREKVSRTDNAGATAKKAAEEKRNTTHPDSKNDRIEIGQGTAHAGVGNRMVAPSERMAPFDGSKDDKETDVSNEEGVSEPKKVRAKKNTWIKGSSESKKMGGSHSVKGKL